jgi:hypothetical protein
MPVTHITKVFAAKDCKLWPLTADVSGAPTYGTGVDVPGLKTVTITGDVNSVELRGDNTKLDSASTMGGVSVSLEFAKLSLDVLSAIFTAATVDSGTDPNSLATWTMLGTTGFSYVGMTANAVGADPVIGDVMFSIYKMIPSSFPEMGLAEEDYKTNTIEFEAVPTISNSKWVGAAIRSGTGAAALAAPA